MNYDTLPDEATPQLTDKVWEGRGSGPGAERKGTLASILSLFRTTLDTVYSLAGHTHTKSQVGLANVDNTTDLAKPISTATQTALNAKAGTAAATTSVDGLMSASDKTKLNAVEANATADMTAVEIRTQLETLTGTNRLPASAVKDIPTGSGVPAGGTTGQVLKKNSNTDGDASWAADATGSGNPPQAVVTVAPASTSRTISADFTTDGSADEVQINQAISALTRTATSESITLGTHLLVNACDATTGWTATGGTVSADTTVKKFGTASLKLTPSGASVRPDIAITGQSISATAYDYLDFWAYVADVGKIWITLTTSNGSRQLMHKVERTNKWVRCKVPLRNAFAISGTLATVTAIKFSLIGGESPNFVPASYTLNVDAVGFTTRRVLANAQVHPGSVSITSRTYETDYDVDFDTGEITPQPGGGITSGSTISVTYNYGGGEVRVLSGQYNITATGIQLKSYVLLNMEDGVVLKQQSGTWAAKNAIIKPANTASQLRHAEVRGGAIIGYRDLLAANIPVDAFRMANFYGLKLSRTQIADMSGAAIVVQNVNSSLQERFTIDDVLCERCGSEWVDIPGGTYGTLAASHDDHMGSLNIEDCRWFEITRFKSHNGMGDGTKVKLSSHGRFSQCEIRNPRMGGWFVEESNNIVGTDNVIDGAGSRGVTFDNSCNRCSFTNSTVNNSGREGCWIDNATSILFAGNIVTGAGLLRSSGGVTGNMSNYAIRVSAAGSGHPHFSSNNIVSNNIVDVSATYCQAAIAVTADVDSTIEGTVISGNSFPGTQKTIINLQPSTVMPITASPITVSFVGQNGGTGVIQAGTTVELPYVKGSGEIKLWRIVGDGSSGSIQLDVRRATYANYPTFTSLVASAPPTISSSTKAESATLTGWTTGLVEGDLLRISVTSVTGFTRATLYLLR